jgi:hypothetical protein
MSKDTKGSSLEEFMEDFNISVKNRVICSCLQEIRDYLNTFDNQKLTDNRKSVIMSLVEEIQIYGNRMEAAIYDYKDVLREFTTLTKLRAEIRKQEAKLRKLKK